MTRSGYFSSVTGFSAIKPLQNHMQHVYEAVMHLPELFDAMMTEDWASVKKAQKQVARGSAVSDSLKREIRQHLPREPLMSVDRRDILDVLLMQDQIANHAKDVAGVILSRKMNLPEDMRGPFRAYGQRSVDCVAQSLEAFSMLDELLEVEFKDAKLLRIKTLIGTLNEIENETDQQQRKLKDALFEHEEDMSPVDVMFTHKIIGSIGELADYSQRAASRLQVMLAR